MHDLRLVGVHEDGEHLLLSDAGGGRFLLAVDDSLRAAVRRDRPHLGQLQIEIEGGIRPREVQARVRAGATADEVASLAGWPVERVRRYEGPVLAERAHIADLAREVRLRRRGGSVTLGAEVSRRLMARGVDLDHVVWDSWRVEGDPWTVVVTFPAGGRERSARWHLDLAGRSVTPGDDEARWLSEDQPDGEGPLAGARLSAVPMTTSTGAGSSAHVYDVEVDGGIGPSGSGSQPSGADQALDLVGAMRARRRAPRGSGRRPHDTGAGDAPGGPHPAGRLRPRAGARPEPLELDPSLMDDPPAAHPVVDEVGGERGDRDGSGAGVAPVPGAVSVSPLGVPLPPAHAASAEPSRREPSSGGSAERSGPAGPPTSPPAVVARHWPLADAMRGGPVPVLGPGPSVRVDPTGPADAPAQTGEDAADGPAGSPGATSDTSTEPRRTGGATTRAGSTRAGSTRRKRSSVPSWDDIMFGARQD